MAEREYILTDEDLVQVLGLALEMNAFLVPSLRYREPEYLIVTSESVDNLLKLCSGTGVFFLISDLWKGENLCLSEIYNESVGRFYVVDQKVGGPAINVYFNMGGEKEGGEKILRVGSIGYYPKYWSNRLQEYILPSPELVGFYKRLNSEIKRRLGKFHIYKSKSVNRKWLVSPSAHLGVSQGTHFLGMDLIHEE